MLEGDAEAAAQVSGRARPGRRRAALASILVAGALLRIHGLGWGLPDYVFPDTILFHLRPAAELVARGDYFMTSSPLAHPPFLAYQLAAFTWIRSALTGEMLPADPEHLKTHFAAIDIMGRWYMVALALLSIVCLYRIAHRLLGERAALLAAAAFALSPMHVLESHRTTPDILMLFLMLLTTDLALAARARRSPSLLSFAFVAAGFAAAAKYPGVYAALLPAWFALRWDGRSWPLRFAVLTANGLLTVLCFAAGLGAVLLQPERIQRATAILYLIGMKYGQVGTDIFAEGWQYVRGVYPIVVIFPYLMGWPLYLLALAGLVLITRRRPDVAWVVALSILPFTIAQAISVLIVPRYYLPLTAYLAIFAGAALDRIWTSHPRLGLALVASAFAYTAVLDWSFNRQLALDPQRELGEFLERKIASEPGRKDPLVVAYPNHIIFWYDSAKPYMTRPDIRMTYLPDLDLKARSDPKTATDERELVEIERQWLADINADVIVLPNWIEFGFTRTKPRGTWATFFRRLSTGALGYRLVAEPTTRFFTEDLYTWGEPMLRTHTDTGIQGYRIYAREPVPPTSSGAMPPPVQAGSAPTLPLVAPPS